ncbi:membrane protein [Lysobacter concretionis Ko07 = DSM 16239]|uniref:Translocation and assembly module subunit TamA n=1 Tax=Lysobacter concretionis Ko07 = DSM 16239 TaxID=1122185 RepID=A0A0A0EUA3_9GAMM|nr:MULTISPECIES: autotransporter assembly complex family protein [Lysobacter]KGM52732.1 membrane protein [Lysobacter concretionis Ko07 = DSM 16239]QOD91167.1 outer membrane protein assembly factor [Lysobacter sp. CW239]
MRLPSLALPAAALCLFASGAVHAAKVERVDILGLDEAMTDNVRSAVTLVDVLGKDLSGRRLAYLVREAEQETREALGPFGYYSPTISVERDRDSNADSTVTITVDPGEPVRVRREHVAIEGVGGRDRYLREDLAGFRPRSGEVFEHPLYEASKTRISRRLAQRGYFDADFASRRVEVTRAEHAADIDLVWTSGPRYDMGPTTFEQTPNAILRGSVLDKLVYWDTGSYYHQGKLDRLRESLARLDYFSSVVINPQPDQAIDGQVPVNVLLVPAKRSIYSAGLSYGTDSGPGVRLGLERRYVNDRGHKALAQLDYAQRRKTLTTQYRIPAFAWADGWYTISAQVADEQTDYMDNRRIEFVGSRNGHINRHLNVIASLHALRERWSYLADDDGDATTGPAYRYATFSYPSLRAEYTDADDLIFPRNGRAGTLMLRGGLEGVGSDASFAQARATASWYRGLGANSRLIARGELGHTFTDELVAMPPSLRFFAGGDRSIRGYGWREVGPRVQGSDGKLYALGAKNVATGSIEYEHYFTPSWGAAAFVDTGSAFDTTPDWHTGVGAGVRWRSPVGPLRLDIGHGLNDADSSFQIYLSVGADL